MTRAGVEIPLSILTAITGAPFFIPIRHDRESLIHWHIYFIMLSHTLYNNDDHSAKNSSLIKGR